MVNPSQYFMELKQWMFRHFFLLIIVILILAFVLLNLYPRFTQSVNAVAIIVLVLITAYYAHKTHEMAEFQRKMIERNQTIYMIRNIISPFINRLEEIISILEKEEYNWYLESYKMEKIDADKRGMLLYKYFQEENPKVMELIAEYNEKVLELRRRISELYSQIRDEYQDLYEELCRDYDKRRSEIMAKYGITTSEGFRPCDHWDAVVSFIIDNKKKLGPTYALDPFWKGYGEKLLAVRENYSEKIEAISNLAISLRETSEKLKSMLEELRLHYMREYSLTDSECLPTEREVIR